jgi:hypothetical protein
VLPAFDGGYPGLSMKPVRQTDNHCVQLAHLQEIPIIGKCRNPGGLACGLFPPAAVGFGEGGNLNAGQAQEISQMHHLGDSTAAD